MKKKHYKHSEYRPYYKGTFCTIIKVFYNTKKEIVGFSDFCYPLGEDLFSLKKEISKMLVATRKMALTDDELKNVKKH